MSRRGSTRHANWRAEFRKLLDARGLKAVSEIMDYGLVAREPEAAARQAEEMGVSYAGVGWIPHQGQLNEATACRGGHLQ